MLDYDLLFQTFFGESNERLLEMEEAVLALETHSDDPELVATIFRNAHTLKGNAAALGFDTLAAFCHELESALDRLRAGEALVTPRVVALLLRSVDVLRRMLREGESTGQMTEEAPADLMAALSGSLQDAGSPLAAAETGGGSGDGAGGAPGTAAAGSGRRSARTLRVGLRKLDQLLDLMGEFTVARGRMAEALEHPDTRRNDFQEIFSGIDALFLQLRELVMELRMVQVGPLFRQQTRVVHDLAQAQGKVVQLVLEGEEAEVDATVIESLRDPITHLVRNGIDHGIEPPAERWARGKDPQGRITLRAYHSAGSIVVEVSDDGAGLDRARILERARRLPGIEEPDKLADPDLFRLVFEPGFSTAGAVTDISGRGVGLDVVRRNVEALRGSVSVQGTPGRGATFSLRMPLTIAIIDGLLVNAGGESFVIPLESIVECVDMPHGERPEGHSSGVIDLRGAPLPYLRLRELFELGEATERNGRTRENVVIVESDGSLAGLAVDALLGKSQTVIKPLGKIFQGVQGLSGSAVLGNGRVALILDVPALLREAVRREARA